MTTIRVSKRPRYTAVDRRTLNDMRLSFRARGVLVWLLDKPDDWKTTAELVTTQGTEGREAVRTALRELETFGYLVRRKWRRVDNGQWTVEWTVYEQPQSVDADAPTVDKEAGPHPISGAGSPDPISGPLLLTTEVTTDLSGLRDPDPECFECHGTGVAYYPDAPRSERTDPTPMGPCPCRKPYVRTDRDEATG